MIQFPGKRLSLRGARVVRTTFAALGAAAPLLFAVSPPAYAQAGAWPMFGQNASNTASINTAAMKNVQRLAPKWVFTTGGEVSARPAVVDNVLYVPDWGGNLWAVDAKKGKAIWGHKLSDYGLPANTNSRTSP